MAGGSELTNSQINKAGTALRQWWNDPKAPTEALDTYLDPSFKILWRFRAAHQRPMTKATRGLRMMVATEGAKVRRIRNWYVRAMRTGGAGRRVGLPDAEPTRTGGVHPLSQLRHDSRVPTGRTKR